MHKNIYLQIIARSPINITNVSPKSTTGFICYILFTTRSKGGGGNYIAFIISFFQDPIFVISFSGLWLIIIFL